MAHMNTNMKQSTNELPAYTEVNGITYQLVGDVYLPLIAVDDKPRKPLGYWGRQRRNYLMREQSGVYAELLLTGAISDHLAEIDEAAERRSEELIAYMKNEMGITEEMKAESPLKWAAAMNGIAQAVREIVGNELIYT